MSVTQGSSSFLASRGSVAREARPPGVKEFIIGLLWYQEEIKERLHRACERVCTSLPALFSLYEEIFAIDKKKNFNTAGYTNFFFFFQFFSADRVGRYQPFTTPA